MELAEVALLQKNFSSRYPKKIGKKSNKIWKESKKVGQRRDKDVKWTIATKTFSITKSNPKKIKEFIDLRWRSLCQR